MEIREYYLNEHVFKYGNLSEEAKKKDEGIF